MCESVRTRLISAFDTMPYNKLRAKLRNYRISGKVLDWVSNFLSERTQQGVINGTLSHVEKVTSGVPQGSVIGPALFLLYINDFPDVEETTVKLFTDDTKTYTAVTNIEDGEKLQNTTNNFCDWSKKGFRLQHKKM